ncbi:Metallo-dependent phosphatase-like protein [Apiospora arundinis]|uniref:Metallo-dependent phosphatase-like protein n=1 Tax=Apiospora arundinis TaxID=335852 RepID=A0ABR2JFT0_9PEZI
MREKAELPPNESQTYSSGNSSGPPDLRLVHYNDVYHIDASSAEPVGGAARFISLMEHYRHDDKFKGQSDLITLFSGDAFNPSLESSITKGTHMVPILNNIGTDAASIGNHDLDFGVRQFRYLASKCKFPWLVANILDPALGENVPIGNCKRTHMLTSSNGIKIGLIGLGEREWLETINSLPPNLIYKSASETAKELVPQLRAEGAEIVIAITHMREPNDNKLAEQTDGLIDIILGGHDHYYSHSLIKGTHVLRSGTDFKQLSYLEARRRPDDSKRWDVDITRRDVTSAIPKHEETVKLVEKLTSSLNATLQKPVGYTAAPLDARFRTVRLRESNLGNFVCDIMRHYYSGDCCIMASGTIRGDQVYVPGPLLMKDIMNCFPFEDPVVVIKASGKNIWLALENSVSQFPALEGRFPQVSNIEFSFDSSKPSGERIVSATIGGEAIDMDRKYVLVTRGYMGRGKDGYDSLLIESEGGECEEVVSEENGILISMMLRQYFLSLRVMGKWKNWGNAIHRHWDNVSRKVSTSHPHIAPGPQSPSSGVGNNKRGWDNWTPEKLRSRRASVGMREESDDESDNDGEGDKRNDHEAEHVVEDLDKELQIMRRVVRKWSRIAGVQCHCGDELKEGEFEIDWTKAIAPRIEGRIVMVGGEMPK